MSQHSSRGKEWNDKRQVVLARADGMCQNLCGNEATHVDHIIPKALGGSDEYENLQALCAKCNTTKGARLGGERITWFHPYWFPGGMVKEAR